MHLHTTRAVRSNITQSPTQEAILACIVDTYSYITSHSLTPVNTSRQSFTVEIFNTVLDMDT